MLRHYHHQKSALYFIAHTFELLDEEFDAPDAAADQHLCRSISAGRWGVHPDAWGWWPQPLAGNVHWWEKRADPGRPMPVDPAWEAEHRRRPVEPSPWKPKPRPRPAVLPPPPLDTIHGVPQSQGGTIKLTCDNCSAEFKQQLRYPSGGRPAFVIAIRAMGREEGWTYIVGRDRCPKCSGVAALDIAPQSGASGAGEVTLPP